MRVNEASQSQRMVWTPDNFVLSEVSKGDYVGHPFRGNQWSDSSGASRGGASSASSQEEIPLLVGVDTVAEANRTGRPLAMMQPENYSPEVKALVKANEQASSLMKEMIQTATEKGNVGLALADPRYGICEAALRITSFEAKRQFQTEYALKHGLELLPPLGEDEYDREEYRYEELGRNEDGRLTRDDEEIRPAELTGSYEASQRKLGFGVKIDADGKPQIDINFSKEVFDQVTIRDLIDPKSKHTWNWDEKLDQEEANKSFRTQIYAEAKKVGIDLPDLPPFARFSAKPLLADGKMTEDEVGLTLAHIKKVGFNFQTHSVNDSADAVGRREDFGTAQATLDNQISEVTPDVKLSVAVPANRVGAILKDGRLKTQFETGTSGGRNVRATREDWEATMFGYQRGMDDALRPIYGMVETGGPKPSSARGNEFYGTVVLVLKDSVKERATFTDGDSLYLNDKHVPVNDASSRLAGKPSSARTLAQKSTGYYETQIHGGVSTSDIERVIIDTSNYKDYEWTEKAPSAALLKSLDKAKIPYEIRQGHPPETSKSRFKPTVLIKGDFVGHPFRGNQWSDSSGVSQGNRSATATPVKHFYGGMFRAEMTEDYVWSVDEQRMVDFLSRQHGGKPFDQAHAGALLDYQAVIWYEDINNSLRAALDDENGSEEYLAELDPDDAKRVRADIKLLDESFETASLDEDAIVFRGIDDQDGWYLDAQVGDIISDKAYQSTSLNPIVATSFASGIESGDDESSKAVLLRIKVPKGFPAIALESATGLLHEPKWIDIIKNAQAEDDAGNRQDPYTVGSEIVLSRFTGYEVTGRSVVDGMPVLDVEVLNGKP